MGNREEFTENDIRPADLMEAKQACREWDRDFLLSRRQRFVTVECPACGSPEQKQYFEKAGFQYRICQICHTVYISPRPEETLVHEFYAVSKNYNFWNKHIFPASAEVRREHIFMPRVKLFNEIMDEYMPQCQSVLEVGAGYGIFCAELKKANRYKRIIALEPSPSLAESCRQKGLETIEKPVEALTMDSPVDVVVSYEVIEHLFSVKKFLMDVSPHISSDGLLILSTPNYQGFDVQCLGMLSDIYDYEHLNYLTIQSIKILLESTGYQIINVSTPGKLDADIVRNKVLDGVFTIDDQPFLKRVLVDNWDRVGGAFQSFLSENGLSSHMMCVATKVS